MQKSIFFYINIKKAMQKSLSVFFEGADDVVDAVVTPEERRGRVSPVIPIATKPFVQCRSGESNQI